MRLTKLVLHGFKSFADHTTLAFEPGATMIVGPNGCGKSNVSDAVRWVLGEQRARALRGAKMEDIIFQGSSARRPVNVAEVSLHFDNEDGALNVPFSEVVITRRVSRSGDSDYFLNKAPCRLRDIHDLVRGTGLAADAGLVIESKMIDALLSDRPDDRRDLFEEAAGVSLYRDRRRSTERRLEETSGDLSRLDDLITEVTSQVRSLGRQRKRAERHAELTTRRFDVELTVAARSMTAWTTELAELETRVAGLREAAPAAQRLVGDSELVREEAQGARAGAEAERGELARMVNVGRQSALQLRGEIAVAEERQRNSVQRRERAERERAQGEEVGSRVSADRGQAAAERAACQEEFDAAAELLEQIAGIEEEARRAVVAARATVDHSDRQARGYRDTLRRVELDREGAGREADELLQRAERLEGERQVLADVHATVQREAAQADESMAATRDRLAETQAALEEARARAKQARDDEAAARHALFRADEALTALQGKVNALEGLERERVGLAPAAARLLKERDRFGAGAVLGPLSDFVSAGADAAADVERFLGASLAAVLVRDRQAAEQVREWHRQANPGPLLLLPVDAAPAAPSADGDLATRVDAQPAAAAWARALLGAVRPLDGGLGYEDARGAVWLPGTQGGPGPLRRRAELAELRQALDRRAAERGEASVASDAARQLMQQCDLQAQAAGEAVTVAQQQLRQLEGQRAELERRRQRAERDLGEAQAAAAKVTRRREELAERLQAFDEQAAELGRAIEAREHDATQARASLVGSEERLDEAREQRTSYQVRQAQAQARLQVAIDRERRLAHEETTAAQRLAQITAELMTLAHDDEQLAGQMAGWQLDLEHRGAELSDREARLADAERALEAADEALRAADARLADARRRAQALGDELHAAELRLTELSGRRLAARERLETEWRRPLDEMLAGFAPLEADEGLLREEAEQLRAQLEQLGPVNPLAIEEHDEESRRLEFITGQRADLAEARASLQQAIREIDTTARELFLATFTQVRENFRQIFMTLFGGGECDLRLENAEAPLDCDIEIHASPRGKRTQRIHLLSSGERNLVALSLLFGIFLTKPSPFCLLDEVDAPLDDTNVGRFVRMLNEFKVQTQFICITHNPRTTTEAADAVYGVTMQEPGVSSIVSVRLRGAASVAEAIAGVAGRADARQPVGTGA